MRVVALISGGKDSCYNVMQCVSEGHEVIALANLRPAEGDELDSYMYQTVGHHAIDLYADAMELPLYRHTIKGTSKSVGKDYCETADDEVEDLYELLKKVKSECSIDAVSVGAILSDYQRVRVENVCLRLGLTPLAYLWRRNQEELLDEMIRCQLKAIIIKIASLGLEPKHLGKTLGEMHSHLLKMNNKYQLNVCGEGGEYETFTLDCPLFKKSVVLDEVSTVIHSDDAFAPVAYLNLHKAHLEPKPSVTDVSAALQQLPMLRSSKLHASLQLETSQSNPASQLLNSIKHQQRKSAELHSDVISVTVEEKDEDLWISNLHGLYEDNSGLSEITTKTMDKLRGIMESRDSDWDMSCIVMVHLYVQNMSMFAEINSVYKTYFGINPPARVCVEADLPSNVALQIDCYCNKSKEQRQTMHVQGLSHWAPANIGPYSQCVKVKNKLYIAGQIPLCPATMTIITGGIVAQSRLSLHHVHRILSAMNCEIDDICLLVCYVTDTDLIQTAKQELQKIAASNMITKEIGSEDKESFAPIVVYVTIPRLPREALIEWHVTAETDCTSFHVSREEATIKGYRCSARIRYGSYEDSDPFFTCRISIEKSRLSDISAVDVMECYCEILNRALQSAPDDKPAVCFRIFFRKNTLNINELYQALQSTKAKKIGFSLVPVSELESSDLVLVACC